MREEMQEVLDLQGNWTWAPTAAMVRRGELIRHLAPRWLVEHDQELASAIGIPPADFLAKGRDATGRKTRVPWTRFASRQRSPRATLGFYAVYLFAFDGSAVYLSLNQGTTRLENGAYVRRPPEALIGNVRWARGVVADWIASRGDLVEPALEDVGERSLGRGYELGNIAAVRYESGAIPDEEDLKADAIDFARALGDLYREEDRLPSPEDAPEAVEVEEAARSAAGKPRPPGAGFRQSKEERDLIEKHAEDLAIVHYEAQGWEVEKLGRPYDLELRRQEERLTVEVKGTTSTGAAVVLTRNEVEHNRVAHPANALVIVRNIDLDRTTSPPTVSGGELFERRPWAIEDDALTVVSYTYEVPPDLYS
jgi:MrcB-like, N-terminal domain/Domain of unknown function (DUF3883)